MGIRFQPGVGPAVLRLAAAEVRDARIRLDDLWGDTAGRELAERLALQPDDRGRAGLERTVRRLAADAGPVDEVGRQVADGISGARPASVRQLARSTGLSERQLLRRCTAVFGYGPARWPGSGGCTGRCTSRSSPRTPRLVEVATGAGFVDQQHLAHEVHAIMGTTPTLLRPGDVRSVQDGIRARRE